MILTGSRQDRRKTWLTACKSSTMEGLDHASMEIGVGLAGLTEVPTAHPPLLSGPSTLALGWKLGTAPAAPSMRGSNSLWSAARAEAAAAASVTAASSSGAPCAAFSAAPVARDSASTPPEAPAHSRSCIRRLA